MMCRNQGTDAGAIVVSVVGTDEISNGERFKRYQAVMYTDCQDSEASRNCEDDGIMHGRRVADSMC
jgi:hypothetical protein